MKFIDKMKILLDIEDTRIYAPLYLGDGYSLSVQASANHYCIPKATLPKGYYSHYELSFLRDSEPCDISVLKKFPGYAELLKHKSGNIFIFVPRELVNDLVTWGINNLSNVQALIELATLEDIQNLTELPPKGEIWYDSQGKVICHICGKSFNKLASHVIQAHDMTSVKYKEMFELNRGEKLTSRAMCEYFRNKPRKDITKYSKSTQYKDGHKSVKKGKSARLQAVLNRPVEYNKEK